MKIILISQILLLLFLKNMTHAGKCDEPNSPEEAAAKEECDKTLSKSPWECQHVCLLQGLGIIKNGKVVATELKSYIEKKYPKSVQEELIKKLNVCSYSYSATPLNSKCDENNAFYRCYDDAVDSVCY